MRERVRVELPARSDQLPHPANTGVHSVEVADGEIHRSHPTVLSQNRVGMRVPVAEAIVERDDDRLRGQRDATVPVIPHLLERDHLIAMPSQMRHVLRKTSGCDEKARIDGILGRSRDHVVHQDRHGSGTSDRAPGMYGGYMGSRRRLACLTRRRRSRATRDRQALQSWRVGGEEAGSERDRGYDGHDDSERDEQTGTSASRLLPARPQSFIRISRLRRHSKEDSMPSEASFPAAPRRPPITVIWS
jgi:hypothetical protein